MTKRILVYAFAPYGKSERNISQDVLGKLSDSYLKRVLPVTFEPQIYREIVDSGAAVIVGLGQYPRGDKIRIELVARNQMGSKAVEPREIEVGGERELRLLRLFDISGENQVVYTNDAGRFVCNYSMYQIMKNKMEELKFAFLHIPKNMQVAHAVTILRGLIAQIE